MLIGIRKEDKNRWERRVPIIPEHIEKLKRDYKIETIVQPSSIRVFSDMEYRKAGAIVIEDLSESDIIFAVKEIPLELFNPGKTYVFFSHTIKGQRHNMPMLKKMMELGCTLIDYERIMDKSGRRLIFFGKYAGLAGAIDTLWGLGKRLAYENVLTQFCQIDPAWRYGSLERAKSEIKKVGDRIAEEGLPDEVVPLIIGIGGYGNVSKGAQEIIDLLPTRRIEPSQLQEIYKNPSNNIIYETIFKEEHIVEPIEEGRDFDLQDYYKNPHHYRPIFERYLPYLSVLINAIYWDKQYPRLVTIDYLKEHLNNDLRLKIIGDISCDIEGAIECTKRATDIDNPFMVFDPVTEQVERGYKGKGLPIMAVDNLPCEFAAEASADFSSVLLKFIPEIASADFSVDFSMSDLPREIKNAVILYKGELTPEYEYLKKYLKEEL